MRKITELAIQAFNAKESFSLGNTTVSIDNVIGGVESELRLHGNIIAKCLLNGELFISTCGWNTPTTKERLNGLSGVSVSTKKGQLYLNGKAWDGEWVNVAKWDKV